MYQIKLDGVRHGKSPERDFIISLEMGLEKAPSGSRCGFCGRNGYDISMTSFQVIYANEMSEVDKTLPKTLRGSIETRLRAVFRTPERMVCKNLDCELEYHNERISVLKKLEHIEALQE